MRQGLGETREQAIGEREAAPYVGFSTHALKKWRAEGRGPAFIRIGRAVRHRVPDLDRWLAAHRVETRNG